MTRTVLSISLALWLMALMLPPGADAVTAITGMVRSQSGQPLPGLVLLEKGEIHNNRWDRGALVDASGRFRIELAEGGQYGLHAYSSGYIYKPNAVRVETSATLEVEVVLVPEPTRANDPVIKRVEFVPSETRKGKAAIIKLEVSDPNGDLGPQVLALTPRRGAPSPWPRPAGCGASSRTIPTACTSSKSTCRRRPPSRATGTSSSPITSATRPTS